jgi:hypothetical protein
MRARSADGATLHAEAILRFIASWMVLPRWRRLLKILSIPGGVRV